MGQNENDVLNTVKVKVNLIIKHFQAPPSMKSVISAVWLFTVAIGNVIVLIIAEARIFEDQSNEFFLFAGLVLTACVIFGWLSYR